MNGFWHALAFLTRFPVPRRLIQTGWQQSPPWYPLTGLILGFFLCVAALFFDALMPPLLSAMLTIACWVLVTGGLHLDGLMDTLDGFASHRERARTLEIMKDSRVGAMGVLAAILLLGHKLAAVISLHGADKYASLVLAPMLARGTALIAIYLFPYARKEGIATSLGRSKKVLWPFILIGLSLAAGMIWLEWAVWLGVIFSFLTGWVVIRLALSKIGGCTGDVYGALIELTETAFLIAAAMVEGRMLVQ
jgi:adenosylcobinamide-GDP ribazoletransferase